MTATISKLTIDKRDVKLISLNLTLWVRMRYRPVLISKKGHAGDL